MRRCELVRHLRAFQSRLASQNADSNAQEMAARSALRYPGAICPPSAAYADPSDRINILLFWHMAHLLEAMTSMLRDSDAELAQTSDVELADHMQLAYTSSNIRNNPLYEALTRVCEADREADRARCGAGAGGGGGGGAPGGPL